MCEKSTSDPVSDKGAFRHVLNEMRQHSFLCDITLIVDTVELPAHRVILAASSSFFHALFARTAAASGTHRRIELPDIQAAALPALIEHIYTGRTGSLLSADNLVPLLQAAARLRLPALRDACAAALRRHLSVETCVRIYRLADRHDCAALRHETHAFILAHSEQVVESAEFALLVGEQPLPQLTAEPVAAAAATVAMPALPLLTLTVGGSGMQMRPAVMVIGGQHSQCFDLWSKQWFQVARKPSVNVEQCALQHGGHIYVMHGANQPAEVYNIATDTWRKCPELTISRGDFGAAVVAVSATATTTTTDTTTDTDDSDSDSFSSAAGCLFVLGGYSYSAAAPVATVERFSPRTGQWRQATAMPTPRDSLAVVALDGALYAIGGDAGAGRGAVATAERYDVTARRWTVCADMSVRRYGAGIAELAGRVYVVGGRGGGGGVGDGDDGSGSGVNGAPLRCVEMYDPVADVWQRLADMSVGRVHPGVVAYAGELYVMGGAASQMVEVYSPLAGRWRELGARMPQQSQWTNACLFEKRQCV